MFCPKCATQNLDGASFCRTCGANISLVSQALTGQIPQPVADEVLDDPTCRTRRRRGKEVTLEQSFKNIFMGIAFLLVAIALSRTIGAVWWFWMLLPAFSMMGTGVAQYIRFREKEKRAQFNAPPTRSLPSQQSVPTPVGPPRRRNTGELMAPVPSVTEGTTRHLGVEAPTRHLDVNER
jgi:zinc-ribbon domain